MTSRSLLLSLALALFPLTGCAEADPELGSSVENHRETNIDFRTWDEPVELTLDEPGEGAVAYGECEQVEPTEEGVDIQIVCADPWTEVAWYIIPAATIEELAAAGVLTVEVSVPTPGARLRASIHRVTDDGKVKLASRPELFDGDRIEAPIDQIADHYVYLAKGHNLTHLWGTGEVAFSVSVLPSDTSE